MVIMGYMALRIVSQRTGHILADHRAYVLVGAADRVMGEWFTAALPAMLEELDRVPKGPLPTRPFQMEVVMDFNEK